MRWCHPTRTRPRMSAATMDRPTQVSLRPALAPAYIPTHGLSVGIRLPPFSDHIFSQGDPLQGPPHPINQNSSGIRAPPHSRANLFSRPAPIRWLPSNTRSWVGSDPWWLILERRPLLTPGSSSWEGPSSAVVQRFLRPHGFFADPP